VGMLTCSEDDDIGGNIPWTRACRDVYDFVSTRRFTATSPCIEGNFNKEMLSPVQVCSHWLNSSTIMQIDIDANRREGQVFFMS